MNAFKDRIVELRRMRAAELMDNEGNWRIHPEAQKDAMMGVLREIGKADALLAYPSEREGGRLVLFNGHLRKGLDGEEVWPVLVTDLTDAEADYMLAVFDPISAMAGMDSEKMQALQDNVASGEWAVRELLRQLAMQSDELLRQAEKEERKAEEGGPQQMELLPFEHYDYILLMFRNELDWVAAVDTLGLQRAADPRKTKRVGLARVIEGSRVIERLRRAEGGREPRTTEGGSL